MSEKECTKCGEVKAFSEYGKAKGGRNGLTSHCKACIKKRMILYFEKNREVLLEKKRAYREKNKSKISAYRKEYNSKNSIAISKRYKKYYAENKDKKAKQWKAWYAANKDKVHSYRNEYGKNRRKVDPTFRMIHNLRSGLRHAMKGTHKPKKTMELLGCTLEHLEYHLSAQFTEGMTLENYGKWHIDHIQPTSSFDHSDPEQVAICWHYTNFQPLWAEDNIRKSDTIPTEHQVKLL